MHPRNAIQKIAPYESFIPRYLSSEIPRKRHYPCGTTITTVDCSPRVDAQASLSRTGIGGWFPGSDEKGNLSSRLSDRFSLEIRRKISHGSLRKGIALRWSSPRLKLWRFFSHSSYVFARSLSQTTSGYLSLRRSRTIAGTARRKKKLMSTRFPSSAVPMELVYESEGDENSCGMGAARVQQASGPACKRSY